MRELVTIGDMLSAARPLQRDRMRRRTIGRFSGPSGWDIGQTNPAFVPGADSNSGGQQLQDAAIALLDYLDANGVPSLHATDANVLAFQTAWNADPANGSANAKLSADGEYGANTHDALAAMVGSVAPPVNQGGAPPTPAPSPAPSPSPAPGPAPIVPATTTTSSHLGLFLLLGALAVGGWLLFRRKRKRSSGGRRSSGAMIVVKNPSRRRGRRNPLEGF